MLLLLLFLLDYNLPYIRFVCMCYRSCFSELTIVAIADDLVTIVVAMEQETIHIARELSSNVAN